MIEIFASIAIMLNDLFALYSVFGSFLLLFSERDNKALNWSRLGLVFGVLGQIALYYTGMIPERIGFLQMPPNVVNALLGLSLLLIFVRSRREKF